jgi:hypothetical protein
MTTRTSFSSKPRGALTAKRGAWSGFRRRFRIFAVSTNLVRCPDNILANAVTEAAIAIDLIVTSRINPDVSTQEARSKTEPTLSLLPLTVVTEPVALR